MHIFHILTTRIHALSAVVFFRSEQQGSPLLHWFLGALVLIPKHLRSTGWNFVDCFSFLYYSLQFPEAEAAEQGVQSC